MRIKLENKVIILSFLSGVILWIVDALFDKIHKFPNESILSMLIEDYTTHELFERPIMLLSFTIFGIIISKYIKRLRHSENRFHSLFDGINDLVLVMPAIQLNENRKFIDAIPVASQTLGYSKEDLLQLTPADLVAPEKLPEFVLTMEKLRVGGNILFETAFVCKEGKTIPMEVSAHVGDFNGRPSVISIIRDITERQQKEAERRKAEECLRDSERQLRVLTSRLLEVQEDERSRITKELHDELGQSLLLMKLQLHAVMDHLRKDQGKLSQECAHIMASIDSLVEDIRRLIRDLSPAVLEDLGLTKAIKLLLEELGKHHHIGTGSIYLDNIDHLFPRPIQLVIYRIFQESLTNIGRYSKATQVSFLIRKMDNQVRFSIKDNGQGFNPEEPLRQRNGGEGIGLSIMKERVKWAGGELTIKSKTGAGTEIAFIIPIRLGEEKESVLSNRLGG